LAELSLTLRRSDEVAMISITNLTKKYGPVTAVDNISLEVKKGEILGFLGPNGAGKTTTLKVITGYLSPTTGQVSVKGADTLKDPQTVKRSIGYVPESFPLYEDMMVYDYLAWVAEIREIPAEKRAARIREIADVCGIVQVMHKDISELSRGYRQRVGLAQAMIHDPDILLLDEPTSGLDPNQIVEIRNLIKKIGQEKTVILSTHILPEVQATCTRVIIINKGKIVADGTPEELLSKSTAANRVHLQFAEHYDAIADNLRRVDFVDNVIKVEKAGERQPVYVVETKKDRDIRAKLFQLAVSKNWTLLEMHSETASLEDVFHQLTTN